MVGGVLWSGRCGGVVVVLNVLSCLGKEGHECSKWCICSGGEGGYEGVKEIGDGSELLCDCCQLI